MNILITGSSSGIGRFLAERFGAHGHDVWGLARSSQADFQRECAARSIRFQFSQADVSNWELVSRCREEVGKSWANLDALICCAGTQSPIGPTMGLDPQAWSANVRLNLDGTFFAIRAFYHLLTRAPRRAKVICFSGGGATSPRANFSAYAASKAGVVRLVENLAQEWSGQNIDINAVAPGAIHTRMTEQVLALGPQVAGEKEYALAAQLKVKVGPALEKVRALVDFLLSADSDGISGKLISAPWDPWPTLQQHRDELARSDIYTLRRIVPEDRQQNWGR